jgi:predicted nuclease of predicted toxin-antitoxin system
MIWIDAHLSPAISSWITATFDIPALALRDVGLRDAEDAEIFEVAKAKTSFSSPKTAILSIWLIGLGNHQKLFY